MSGLTLDEIKASARPLLLRLALVSQAPAGRLDAMPRTRGTPEHRKPPGDAIPEAERLRDHLTNSESVASAEAIVDEIRAELARATRRALPLGATETMDELAERIVEDGVGWPLADVALACRCLPSVVRAARLSFGRDPETGRTLPGGDPVAVARVLRDNGRSWREIERLTGVAHATLRYRLRHD